MPDLRLPAAVAAATLMLVGTAQGAPIRTINPLEEGALSPAQRVVPTPAPLGLAPARENVELVSKLELKGRFGNVRPGQIADVSAKGDYAYLNSWQDQGAGTCERGGVFVVDIRDPANPREVGFIPSLPGSFPGEGSQVTTIDTPAFRGDVLTINNENCAGSGTNATRAGGISLIDVRDPLNPVKLADGFGDGIPSAADAARDRPEHQVHSAFTWQDGSRAYTVMVDNFEQADVDIVDITNPRAPQIINELDLDGGVNPLIRGTAYGNRVFLHDMVVKEIAGVQTMLLSYWDGGYVKLNVEDPRNAFVIAESDFAATDPLFPGASPPEGNAHEAEFSADNRFVVAADEDFAPFRLQAEVGAGRYDVVQPSDPGVRSVVEFNDRALGGDAAVYVGTACLAVPDDPALPGDQSLPADPVPAAPADDGDPDTERIAVVQRGNCTFAQKVQQIRLAGWDGYAIFNNANRPDGDPLVNPTIAPETLTGVFFRRADALTALFGITDNSTPAKGAAAQPFVARAAFDGWGYMHLYDNRTMGELDQYAPTEAIDERFAIGFGDLSVHEAATDPETSLAYVSYYNAGFRVLQFGDGKLTETGRFIDTRGNNFWGVHVMNDRAGRRMVLASDRDYGLYILRYTGPGAPVPAPVAAVRAPATPVAPRPVTPPTTTRTVRAPKATIAGKAVRLSRTGYAAIAVRCPASASGTCRGTARLDSGGRRLGTRSFTARAGRLATVRVKLSTAARRLLTSRKRLRVQVTVQVRDATNLRGTSTRRITLRPAALARVPATR